MTRDAMRFKNYARFTFARTGEDIPAVCTKGRNKYDLSLEFLKGSCNIVSFIDGSRDAT
jgi:hypothetical protein